MSDKEQVEREILEYLAKEPNLSRDDKARYLRALFNKHFEFEKLAYMINYHDFHDIVSNAKGGYLQVKPRISSRNLYPTEIAHAAMIQSVISHLNSKGLLKKFVKIDFTEDF